MANEITKIGAVTKRVKNNTSEIYYEFPEALIIVDTIADTISYRTKLNYGDLQTTPFLQITDPLGATNAEDYADELARLGYYTPPQIQPALIEGENWVIVQSLDDLPLPVGNVITLDSGKIYQPIGIVDLAGNGLRVVGSTKIQGNYNTEDGFISTYPGVFIESISGGISLEKVTLTNLSCSKMLDAQGAGIENISIDSCILSGSNTLIELDTFSVIFINESQFIGFSNGILIEGSNIAFIIQLCSFVGTTGTLIDLDAALFDNVEIRRISGEVSLGVTGINVASNGGNINSGGGGIIDGVRFVDSGGVTIAGYSPFDLDWFVSGNKGILTSDRSLPSGFGQYSDGLTSPTTLNVTTTPSIIQIDGLGGASNSDYLPLSIRGTSELWDAVNDRLSPISIGDTYNVRIDLEVTAKSGNPNTLTLVLDIGGQATITIPIVSRDISVSKTPPFTSSTTTAIFTLDTFVTNGGQLFLSTDTGSLTISKRSILIVRTSSGAS